VSSRRVRANGALFFLTAPRKWSVRVNHDVLMARLARRVSDKRVLRLIRRYLEAGVMVNGVVMERSEGTPQVGPLSPLLANVLLDEVDKELEKRGHAFVRYADDCNVYVQSRRAGARVLASLKRLYGRLRLRINEEKSAVARVWDRKFLGYSFWVAPGKRVVPRIASKSLATMKEKVGAITRRNGGRSMEAVAAELRSYLTGWRNYFALAENKQLFRESDEWLRRRLRALQLKHWRRGTTMHRELTARGVGEPDASAAARFGRHWWHVAGHKALQIALPIAHFDALGVPRLAR
jgi:RNA-directed DNA polymerase